MTTISKELQKKAEKGAAKEDAPPDPSLIAEKIPGSEVVAGNVLLGNVYLFQDGKVTGEGRKALQEAGVEVPELPEPPVGAAAPVIATVTPASGADGSQVIVAGSGFQEQGATSKLQIGTVEAAVAAWSDNSIEAMVMQGEQPMGAPMVVTVTAQDGQQAMSTPGYTFLDAGNIDSLSAGKQGELDFNLDGAPGKKGHK